MKSQTMRVLATVAGALFWVISGTMAQGVPSWATLEGRNRDYPQSEYYTGFAMDRPQYGESPERTMQRVKKSAMEEAASSVRVRVQNTTSLIMSSIQRESNGVMDEQIRTSFNSATQTATDTELPGLKLQTYTNPQTREVYAFAYTRKSEVINYYDKQLTMNLAKLEAKLQSIDQLVDLGQKVQARKTAEGALEHLSKIDAAQKMLSAVDPNATQESLQMAEATAAARQLVGKLAALTQGVKVYVTGLCMNFGKTSTDLATKLKALMSADCSFVENEYDCDYKITLKGQTREGYNDPNIKMAFVDVEVSVFDMAKQREVFSQTVTAKGGGTTWHLGGTEAYKTAAPKAHEAVKPFIK